jgi:hypothetical protein
MLISLIVLILSKLTTKISHKILFTSFTNIFITNNEIEKVYLIRFKTNHFA